MVLLNHLLRIVLKIKAHSAISQLSAADSTSKLLEEAILETLNNSVAPNEQKWIDQIEILRKELNSSDAEVSIEDYGAGSRTFINMNTEPVTVSVVRRNVGKISRSAGKPYIWALLLFKLIRKFKPALCLELGTSLGISASFQAAALKLNGTGKIVTLEGADSLASLAEKNFKSLDLDNVSIVTGRFQDTLSEVLRSYNSFDYAFIDGHHEEKATIEYFKQILPSLSKGALLIIDDISWSAGMKRAWKKIKTDNRIKISVDLWQMGICIID